MKITQTDTGYILEDPQTSDEAQVLEMFVENLRRRNEVVETNGKSEVDCQASQ